MQRKKERKRTKKVEDREKEKRKYERKKESCVFVVLCVRKKVSVISLFGGNLEIPSASGKNWDFDYCC
jgi:hypothetical protein